MFVRKSRSRVSSHGASTSSKGGAAHNRIGRVYRAIGQLEEAMRNLGTGHALFDSAGDVRGVACTGCAADVVFYTVDGGGHAWPGGGWMPEAIVGHITQDIDATRVMWAFFEQHPLRDH